jgi:flagellar basal body-associated protein FliL
VAELPRTKLRIVLILLALILVMATILSGLLTYWVGSEKSPASDSLEGEAGQKLPFVSSIPNRCWLFGFWVYQSPQEPLESSTL